MKRTTVWQLLAAGTLMLSACADGTQLSSRNVATPVAIERTSTKAPRSAETSFNAYITGYSYWDNTPRGSAAIARPVIHRRAGGTGTYNDPITIAVGHVIEGRRQTLDYPAGTRFYLPRLRKYVIVEDVCGDGRSPQDGPCHTGYRGNPWLDIYIDGKEMSHRASDACMNRITGVQPIVMNPRRGYPVLQGSVSRSGCRNHPV